MLVLDNEDHVESRQYGRHEVDVVVCLSVVPTPEN